MKVRFSNGKTLDLQYSAGSGTDVLLRSFTTAGLGAMGIFIDNIRTAEWVEISFGAAGQKFSLAGSVKALDAIKVYLHK